MMFGKNYKIVPLSVSDSFCIIGEHLILAQI